MAILPSLEAHILSSPSSTREQLLRSVALRRAEEQLREQSERFRITLSSIGDAVISTDAAGVITFLNGVAEKLTGWTQHEAVGRPLSEVFNIINSDTRAAVENPALRALREGTVVALADPAVLIARDGVERPVADNAALIHDASGTIVGAVLVFRDVADRLQAYETHGRLAAIVESSQDVIISKTLDGRIRSWNRWMRWSFDEAGGPARPGKSAPELEIGTMNRSN